MGSNGKQSRSALPVAVDAMGGDLGLDVQVEGAISAFLEHQVPSVLVGPKADLQSRLDALGAGDIPVTLCDAPDVISMDDSPAKAVRRKPKSSLCVAYDLVRKGKAAAILSSGNSGAMMAAGTMKLGLLPGIERPAIAALMPVATNGNPNVILDVGANVDCHAQNLVQFALMGAIYHSSLFESDQPRVALLSNGKEASKGTDRIRSASMILSQLSQCNYVGYVEGRDVTSDAADVIVCDGFVGNVLLKSMEGCVRFIAGQIRDEGRKSFVSRLGLGLSKGLFKRLFNEKFDYTAHGGAPLLGLNGLAVVLHGSSDKRAVKNAIRFAETFVKNQMTEKIGAALSQLDEELPQLDGAVFSGVFGATGLGNGTDSSKAKKTPDEVPEEEVADSTPATKGNLDVSTEGRK